MQAVSSFNLSYPEELAAVLTVRSLSLSLTSSTATFLFYSKQVYFTINIKHQHCKASVSLKLKPIVHRGDQLKANCTRPSVSFPFCAINCDVFSE